MTDETITPALSPAQEERIERALQKSIFLATPVARRPVWQFSWALAETIELLAGLGIKRARRWVIGNSNLCKARNELCAEFLASGCTDMLWIDDDMGWNPGDVIRLLASDKDLIGGVGRKKCVSDDKDPESWCLRALPDDMVKQDEMGAIEVAGIGCGFTKISRVVFEDMIDAFPELKRPGTDRMTEGAREFHHRFYHFEDDGPGSLSEDLDFCERWRTLGGTVWADPKIELVHVGDWEFSGTFATLLQQQEEE